MGILSPLYQSSFDSTQFFELGAWYPGVDITTDGTLISHTGGTHTFIDMGRANGIDVAFVNPLTETMKKLSENALTYQKAAAE